MSIRITSIRATQVTFAAADVHAPIANTAAVVTYSGVDISGQLHVISGVAWSYVGGTPAGGNLKIEDGAANVVFTMDIPAAGNGVIYFDPQRRGTANTSLIITLAAGGGSVVGKLSVLGHWLE